MRLRPRSPSSPALPRRAAPPPRAPQGFDFPAGFAVRDIADQRRDDPRALAAATGPAVVLLHGYGETGDMWVAAGRRPGARPHGDRARPARPGPVVQAGRRLRQEDPGRRRRRRDGRAAASSGPTSWRTTSATWSPSSSRRSIRSACAQLVLIDAPVPGVGPWDEILKNPLLWHFRFGGPDMERLVAGRERIYLDRFWNEFSAIARPLRRGRARALRRSSTRCPARCIPASRSSPPSTRTRSTTAPSWRTAGLEDAGPRARRREVLRPDDGRRDARRRATT